MTTSIVNTTAPTTGSTQPGSPFLGRISILTVNAPKNRHPNTEWIRTRVLYCWKPSAYRQWTATGTVSRNAIRPDHLCSPPIHGGAVTRGTFPYITRAEPSWTSASTAAPVASQDFTEPGLENPAMLTAMPVGLWSRP